MMQVDLYPVSSIQNLHPDILKNRNVVETALLFTATVWALNFTVIKNSLAEIPPFAFNGLRYLFAVALMWGVLLWRKQQFTIPKKDWLPLLGLGLLGNLIYQILFIVGMDLTFAANGAVILGTIPIWVALFSHFSGIEKMNRFKTAGVIFAFTGIVFIMAGGGEGFSFNVETYLGDLLILLAAITFGGYTILSKSYLTRYTPIQFTTIMTSVGCVLLILIGLPGMLRMNWSAVSSVGYGGIIYSGLLAIGIAFLIWNYGLKTIGAVHTSTYQNLVPVLGVIFGIVLLNEQLTWLQYIGSGLVIAGIVLARWKTRQKPEPVRPS